MSIDINYEMLKHAASSASKKYERTDLTDDLSQELWFDIKLLQDKYIPEKGSIEGFLYRHAEYKVLAMIRGVKEVHVEDIYEFNREIEVGGGQVESAEPEDDLIENIDKNSALDKIREKLKRNGCSSNLKVVQTYKEKLEGRKSRKKIQGRYDTPDRQKLVSLHKHSGVSQARFATALGISPQLYQSYIDGTVQVIPKTVMKRAETVVIEELPTPLSKEEMIAWSENLIDMVPLENVSIRRIEEYLTNILSVSRTTITRWRGGKTRLMPDKSKGITAKIKSYVDSVR